MTDPVEYMTRSRATSRAIKQLVQEADEPMTVRAIAKAVGVSQPTARKHANDLARCGYFEVGDAWLTYTIRRGIKRNQRTILVRAYGSESAWSSLEGG